MTDTGVSDRELVLTRVIDAPREKLYRCWTEPALLKQWFAPRPWTTPKVEMDLRPGGASVITMADETGNEYPNPGQYLELVPNERLVFTDAFTEAWMPSEKPFMAATVTFEDIGGGTTRYTATARHWSVEDREAHEQMGFLDGWGQCAEQLEALAKTL